MKITHVSASLTRNAGGIFEIELALAQHLQRLGVENAGVGIHDEWWDQDGPRWQPLRAEVFPARGPKAFGYCPALAKFLEESNCDLAHLHSMWMYPSVAVSRWSGGGKRPYVVTPNGMLEPWALRNAAWKKKIAAVLYERGMLTGAACLHANTEKELNDIRAFGLRNPVAIIPNGIELPEEGVEGRKVEGRRSGERKILLFLGRLHPKKGLVSALRAWSAARHNDWQLVIAGWDQGGHEAELKQLCDELSLAYGSRETGIGGQESGVGERESGGGKREAPTSSPLPTSHLALSTASVQFVGPMFGEKKNALLRQASAFILPSFSEGLPMSVLEAWAYRLPVLMTDHCNIPAGFEARAAIRIDTEPSSIAAGIRELFELSDSDQHAIGDRGRQLVEDRFTWQHVAAELKEVYAWILGGGEIPGCVVK
jgi:glycosyltransferase involved in cell wall biosynthesis